MTIPSHADAFSTLHDAVDAAAESAVVRAAAALLQAGRLVAFPTETVYGLGADATNDAATAQIFAAKGRPDFNPLIVHVPDLAAAETLVQFNAHARRLAAAFWPGPLTLVLPRRTDCPVSLLCSAGLDSLGVRVPGHPLALALLRAAGRPVAAPSANRSGRISPTSAAHVEQELGDRVAMVLDGGPCRVGVESTVLDLTGDGVLLLRPGGVTESQITQVLGQPLDHKQPSAMDQDELAQAGLLSPGMLDSHYAPERPVRLNATVPQQGEAFIAFGRPLPGTRADAQLSEAGDTVEAASHLFATLRALDRPPFTGIAVMPIPDTGLGLAINDRLRRAAAPRPEEQGR
ncbi:MAG TPA: L-threonylcarbamoyladenylate synthase [Stellaceae bacterium]|jgi:L-threonylcarbamoyladenylate synthase|nr:L-threonylcarbamoyladenylate synthase [Stellaceae bacterium]